MIEEEFSIFGPYHGDFAWIVMIPDIDQLLKKVYNKIVAKAGKLVAVGDENHSRTQDSHRQQACISDTPFLWLEQRLMRRTMCPSPRPWTRHHEIGVNFIGGYSALVQKGYQKGWRFSSIPFLVL